MRRLPRLACSAAASVCLASWGGTDPVASADAARWGPPHLLRHSYYFTNSDLGKDHDAVGAWLSRVEVDGTGTTAVGHQRRRSEGSARRPSVAVLEPEGSWSGRPLAGRGRSGYTWVGVDGQGRVTAVWLQGTGDRSGEDQAVRWARRSADGKWGPSRPLRDVDARPTAFDVAPAGFGVLTYISGGAAFAKVLTPGGAWRPGIRVSGERLGKGVSRATAVVSNRGRVTAAFWSITVDNRSETSGPLQRGGVSAQGRRSAVVDVGHLDGNDAFRVTGSPGGSVAIGLADDQVDFRLRGDRWRRSTQRVTAVAVSNRAVAVAWLSAPQATPQQYFLSDYSRSTGAWSAPRVVATMAGTEHAGGSPSALDLVRTGTTTYLGFSLWHTDTGTVTYSTRVVTDVDGVSTVDDLGGCFVDLDARGSDAALLTTPRCQPGGRLSVRTR